MKQGHAKTDHERIKNGLRFSATCSQIGMIMFCFVGLVSTELTLFSSPVRLAIVSIASFFTAVGAEGGSRYSIAAAFERNGTLTGWDRVGAVVSQLSSALAFVIGILMLFSGTSPVWLYIFNVVFVGVDATFNYVALGLHNRHGHKLKAEEERRASEYRKQSLDREVEEQRQRLELRRQQVDIERQLFALRAQEAMYTENHETSPMAPVDAPVEQNGAPPHTTSGESGDSGAPVASTPAKVAHQSELLRNASISDWRELLPTLATRPTTGDEVNSALVAHGFAEKPQTTANRWAKDAAV